MIADWGVKDGYFTKAGGEVFYDELTWLCLNQYGAFNSPVWFNVGLFHQYGVGKKSGKGNWFFNRQTGEAERAATQYEYPQGSACFIQSVKDDMESIMHLAYSEAIRINPEDAASFVARAYAYVQQDDCEKAISDYKKAMRLNPGSPQPYNDLAWVLATSSVITVRDGKEAVALAKKACELDAWKHSASVDTLAAAFAEAGDFTEAIKYQKQALSMADVMDKYRAEAQSRLTLYQQGKPYRETPK